MSTDLAGLVISTIHLVNKTLAHLLPHLREVLPHLVCRGGRVTERKSGGGGGGGERKERRRKRRRKKRRRKWRRKRKEEEEEKEEEGEVD